MYESKKGPSVESKRIIELEQEVESTKTYYNKRIREIEEKNKYRVPAEKELKKVTLTKSKPPVSSKPDASIAP